MTWRAVAPARKRGAGPTTRRGVGPTTWRGVCPTTLRGAGATTKREDGQAALLLLATLLAIIVGAFVLGGIARGVGAQAEQQRAADLAALAGAKAMHDAYGRLFEPGGLSVAAYKELGRRMAM